jgi:hypothetical protein
MACFQMGTLFCLLRCGRRRLSLFFLHIQGAVATVLTCRRRCFFSPFVGSGFPPPHSSYYSLTPSFRFDWRMRDGEDERKAPRPFSLVDELGKPDRETHVVVRWTRKPHHATQNQTIQQQVWMLFRFSFSPFVLPHVSMHSYRTSFLISLFPPFLCCLVSCVSQTWRRQVCLVCGAFASRTSPPLTPEEVHMMHVACRTSSPMYFPRE